ncbi:MAG: V-type ATP synthase subunit B [Treponema sp.]|jgi:V/A-type H+-transporting ATPase subunit B|nr:V-type ATP synthase subunit B [Treponema sp.]
MRGVEYRGLTRIEGPVVITARRGDVGFNEVVAVYDRSEGRRLGRVVDMSEEWAAVQIFGSTTGLSADDGRVEFLGRPMEIRVGPGLLGRVFNGLGEPVDGCGEILSSTRLDVNGLPINPSARTYPRDFIQTGISAIDGMNTLIRGQKLPIFSGNGLPHNRLAAQIVRQARILSAGGQNTEETAAPSPGAGPPLSPGDADGAGSAGEQFVVVFCAMGVKYDVARFFLDDFEKSGVLANVAVFLSLADTPSLERLVAPRCALTAAEYLAYERNMHVLVVMTDMTNYCEALREVSSIRGEVPSRKGYPGYLYSDLASLYERAGKIEGSTGSITQLPILTMPNDDISHPIPDLSGYITEGQIVLDRELSQKGIYPPVAGLPSLSRLMKDGIGEGMTREDHKDLSSQLFAAYSRVRQIRNLASIIGEEELSAGDKRCLKFGEKFEQLFLNQGEYENRDIGRTLDLGWQVLAELPREDLLRIRQEYIEKYMKVFPGTSPG